MLKVDLMLHRTVAMFCHCVMAMGQEIHEYAAGGCPSPDKAYEFASGPMTRMLSCQSEGSEASQEGFGKGTALISAASPQGVRHFGQNSLCLCRCHIGAAW